MQPEPRFDVLAEWCIDGRMTTILSPRGLLEIPEAFRVADNLRPGQPCEIDRVGKGEYLVRVAESVSEGERAQALLGVLSSCPVKDWWVEPDRSERTTLDASPLFAE